MWVEHSEFEVPVALFSSAFACVGEFELCSLLWGMLSLRFNALLLFLLALLICADAVCPYCFGNIASCTFGSPDGKCPACDVPVANAGVVGGLAAMAGTALTLTDVIRPRFLRIFTKAHLTAILQLVMRPQAGTIFEIKSTSKLASVLQAISVGQVTLEQAMVAYAGFIDDDDGKDAPRLTKLRETYKMLSSAKDVKAFGGVGVASSDLGVWTWLYGKVSTFVGEKGMQTTVSLDTGSSSTDLGKAGVMSATIKRFKDPWEFAEALNLFLMFAVALGLCSSTAMAEFYEYVIYDTIRMRDQPWQLAAELFVVMLRRIEDSGGKLTLISATDEVHLNTVLDEARSNAVHFHGSALFFRSGGGTPQPGKGTKFNGKFSASSGACCVFFNTGKEHPASALHPDGTCKFNHVCDHWVSDKGKAGRCMGTAGTPGHTRNACDNPKRCDDRQQ